MTKDEALKLALEALSTSMYPQPRQLNAIAAIKAALAQPRPVAIEHCLWARNGNTPCPHTTPPQREWVGLTNEDMVDCLGESCWDDVVRKAEAKLRSKNT